MDVDKNGFYPHILNILTNISTAHFVAIDLELSGVPSKQLRPGDSGGGRKTLQARYTEIKQAAERYQILQFGLTCVEQDFANGKYVLRPYNFDLSPLIEERGLDIERVFSFQSGAVDFLLKTGFDVGRPFYTGVPYLSREESREAREQHARRQNKSALPDIQIKPTETESLAFLEYVRAKLNRHLKSKKGDTQSFMSVEIGPMKDDTIQEINDLPVELSRYEKRLVHQLVRSEYPEFVSISKRGYIQVMPFDKHREDRIAADRKRELEERINRQKGFRWIIEALHGSDLSKLDLRECARNPEDGSPVFADMADYRARFDRAHPRVRANPRILVGHNCFLDLVYIYRTFIGSLPDTVEEFQDKIHDLWPLVVDTKYMCTHNCSDINNASSLEHIALQLSAEQQPTLEIDETHAKYKDKEAFHEAGYDSLLTAQVAIRLAAKLEKEGVYVDVAQNEVNSIRGAAIYEGADSHDAHEQPRLEDLIGFDMPNMSLEPNNLLKKGASSVARGFTASALGDGRMRGGNRNLTLPDPIHPGANSVQEQKEHRCYGFEESRAFDGAMPALTSDFWRVYGNKLRVFGTEEGLCVLERSSATADELVLDEDLEEGGVEIL